ncbi:hypothetical protein H4Q32_028733 [Labeo rohita]|uniref:Anaphylatoxin-like domain-containing protein n=1 Tax=Labeo rohita TaxID=84645 RepID=A0ABQ8N1G1_LABRO|nr:hypothetical protein H4Q32_028733 [Labeo rohita]
MNCLLVSNCPTPAKRKRRAESLQQITVTLVLLLPSLFYTNALFLAGKYSGDLKQCCVDGMKDNILGYTCERRATYIVDGPECAKAFLHCCNEMKTRKGMKAEESEMILARSDDDDDFYTDSEDIVSRTQFPESWLWEEVDLCDKCQTPTTEKVLYLKDSITTWQILAVSLSPTLGICVAEPEELVVFKQLFIDLKIPYSAVRGEQLEIKAIIHNYTPKKQKVRVEFMETEDVCSSASKKGKYRTIVNVDKGSSTSASYVIIPMTSGKHMIEVKASAYDAVYTDGVRKPLKVVPEGVLTQLERGKVELNPVKNGEKPAILRSEIPPDWVPDTPANTYISITEAMSVFFHDTALNETRGDVRGKDAEVSLTAFVVIAMQEGSEICAASVSSLHESIRKAVAFLEGRFPKLTNPYAVAMTSYAMANVGKLNKDILMKHSTKLEAGVSWTVPGQHHHSLEATAYAVLALVKAKDFDRAGEAVHWLGKQQSHYGGSGTTQATIMVFQAVAEYRTQVNDRQNFNLEVELSVAGRSKPVKYTIKNDNKHLTRSDKMDINKDFNVTARGTGTATLSVLTLYYARPAEKSDCEFFDLTVKMEEDPETKHRGALKSYKLTMDFYYKSDKSDATMTILDIGIPTGFTVDDRDLEELSTGKERYVQKFEMDKVLSERGSLILYLDKVLRRESQRIVFRMHKMIDVVFSTSLESIPGLNTGLQDRKAKLENTGTDTLAFLSSRIDFSKKDTYDEHDACERSDADCRCSFLPFAHIMYVLSAPNLLRVGSFENVFVEAQDYTGGNLNARIIVKNHPKKNLEILSKSVALTADNNFQILTDIKIPDDQNFFSNDPLEKQYVYLQAQFPTVTLEKVVMVSFQSGYIFVQTDKPIYTPASTVNYRIFSLTPDQHPFDGSSVTVDIMNPQGITLDRDQFQPKQGIRTETFALPELARLLCFLHILFGSSGIWKLIAKYSNTPQKNFTTEFEVMEYVLPSFEVTINPRKSFFYVNENSLTILSALSYLRENAERRVFCRSPLRWYSGELKMCCVDGLRENDLGYSCERRAQYITDLDSDACIKAFLHCCEEMTRHKKTFAEEDTETSTLRTGIYLKDSITTWQITAISLSKTLGMCVADPYEITVKKDFFIDLKMPYSAVRNEQLEIKATVNIRFKTSEGICSSASKKQKGRITVSVGAMSSIAVPIIIIPMELKEQWIEVEAYSPNRNDAIKRNLKVVPEGVLTEVQQKVVEINPSEHPGGSQVVFMRSDIPRRKVPNTPANTGDVRGKDADASLTAFILIAMQEGSKICAGNNLKNSMKKATDYLELRVHSLRSSYAVAMTSYALAHAGKLNKDILISHSTESKDGLFWQVPGQHHHSLEATGYAVLALVRQKDFERAGRAATIMVFQAVAEYRIQVKKTDINLNLELAVQERKEKTRIAFRSSNNLIARSDKFDITKSFNITAQGTGVAMLSVFSVYYALPEEKDYVCNMFDLSVQMVKQSEVSYDGASESYQIIIEYIFKDPLRVSTMSILDIGLLTGFKVDEHDLAKSFEMNKELSERGSLIIYIDKISNKEKERLVFRMHKINEVGMLQPAGITVYEYNAPGLSYLPNEDPVRSSCCGQWMIMFCICIVVYKIRVSEMGFSLHADIYNMTIEQVLKEGGPDKRISIKAYWHHRACRQALPIWMRHLKDFHELKIDLPSCNSLIATTLLLIQESQFAFIRDYIPVSVLNAEWCPTNTKPIPMKSSPFPKAYQWIKKQGNRSRLPHANKMPNSEERVLLGSLNAHQKEKCFLLFSALDACLSESKSALDSSWHKHEHSHTQTGRMDVKLLFLTVVFLSSPLLTLCDPLFVLSAPNLLRVGSSENVFVEAQDYSGGDLNVKIIVKNHPKKNLEILSKSVKLTTDNNFQILTDIKIRSDRDYFSDDPDEKQYVYLQAQFPSVTLEKVVMLSFQSGYIFYRIFSMTSGLKPSEHAGISIEIMDPQGITTMKETIFPERGIRSGKYAVPQPASPGIWKVVTRFTNTPQKNYTADFEVKEYVLPTYEVTLSTSQSFFCVKDASLTVSIEAREEEERVFSESQLYWVRRFSFYLADTVLLHLSSLSYTNIVFSAGQYTGDLRKCCVDGMRDNKLGYTCERRATYIVDGHDCVQAFLHCCHDVESRSMEAGEEEMILARSEDSDYYESFDEITSRTQFPESWLWAEELLPVCPEKNNGTTTITRDRNYLKESITTWQIFAVSLSETHGICVADPYEIIVYKRFFIDLKVPYSAIRNEQLQIRAILHNYTNKKIRARLEFMETKHICSSASKKGTYLTEVEVESMSSRSVPHVMIPLELGNHWIEVKAAAYDSVYSDGVRKILKVVSEGVLTKVQEANVELNPAKIGGVQQVSVRGTKPDTQVPNTPANTYITGDVRGKDDDASLTAFVLIAMQEGSKICAESNLQSSMKKAVDYLLLRVHSLTNPYAVAMTSYALAHAGKLNKDILRMGTFWRVPGAHQHSLEATGYALLALVKARDFQSAGAAVRWLRAQRTTYGDHGSTQASIIVFQAVAEYRMEAKKQDMNLNVELSVEGRKTHNKWTFTSSNKHVMRSDKVKLTQKFNITAHGNGLATLSSSERDAAMTVVDVGLLTGFKVDDNDLSKLSKGKEKYIERFEMEHSERGALTIFLNKVSNKERERIAFRMHKINEVGMLQPAGVTVYEYNAPGV